MKRWIALGAGLWLVGCASEPEPLPPVPSVEMAQVSGVPLDDLQFGRAVFVSNCTRCHEPMMPRDVSTEDWHVVVPGMAWNAGISSEEEDAVLRYILAAKRLNAATAEEAR